MTNLRRCGDARGTSSVLRVVAKRGRSRDEQ